MHEYYPPLVIHESQIFNLFQTRSSDSKRITGLVRAKAKFLIPFHMILFWKFREDSNQSQERYAAFIWNELAQKKTMKKVSDMC